jgi:protein N-terminal methyltransferase
MSTGSNEKLRSIVIQGSDTNGKQYTSAQEMWKAELGTCEDLYDPAKGWYGKSLAYWEKVPPTMEGVLGGMDHVHEADIRESKAFIEGMAGAGRSRALDCGAGIGRISKCLLTPMFDKTDLLEPMRHMLEQAAKDLPEDRVGDLILASMEKAELKQQYDVVVIQWVAIYLTDEHFASFLAKCKAALKPSGFIFFKENTNSRSSFVVDKEDSSLTRSDLHYKQIFAAAGVEIVTQTKQKEWPEDLFPVMMYALR